MRADMLEQPAALERLLREEGAAYREAGRALRARRPRLLVFAARGSSDHAATLGRYLVERFAGVPTSLAAPSVVTVFRARLDLRGAAVVGISQSGRSPDVVDYLAQARRWGAFTLALTNDGKSPLARAAERTLLLGARRERSIPATKTFLAQAAGLYLLAGAWAGARALEEAARAAPEMAARALDSWRLVREGAARRKAFSRWIVLGRGLTYPVALEEALKFKEAAGLFADGASAADFLHGPVAAFGKGACALLLGSGGPGDGTLRRLAARLPDVGKRAWVFAPQGGRGWPGRGLPLPEGATELSAPFASAVLGQIAALELGLARGVDPDRPPGLRKITAAR